MYTPIKFLNYYKFRVAGGEYSPESDAFALLVHTGY